MTVSCLNWDHKISDQSYNSMLHPISTSSPRWFARVNNPNFVPEWQYKYSRRFSPLHVYTLHNSALSDFHLKPYPILCNPFLTFSHLPCQPRLPPLLFFRVSMSQPTIILEPCVPNHHIFRVPTACINPPAPSS